MARNFDDIDVRVSSLIDEVLSSDDRKLVIAKLIGHILADARIKSVPVRIAVFEAVVEKLDDGTGLYAFWKKGRDGYIEACDNFKYFK